MTENSRVEIAKLTLQYLLSIQAIEHKHGLERIMSVVPTEEAKNANFRDLYEIVFDVIAQSIETPKNGRLTLSSQSKISFIKVNRTNHTKKIAHL